MRRSINGREWEGFAGWEGERRMRDGRRRDKDENGERRMRDKMG